MLTFFFDRSDDFSEIRDFVRVMDARYGLNLQTMHGDFKAGVEHLVHVRGIKAIFLGTRRYVLRDLQCNLLYLKSVLGGFDTRKHIITSA